MFRLFDYIYNLCENAIKLVAYITGVISKAIIAVINVFVLFLSAFVALFVYCYNFLFHYLQQLLQQQLTPVSMGQNFYDALCFCNSFIPVSEIFSMLYWLANIWTWVMIYKMIKSWVPGVAT